MVRERNKEIESIIEKLGDETHSTQKQLMQQYERKSSQQQKKHLAEIEEYKSSLNQWREKMTNVNDGKEMLDENVRVLTRRINDMEIETTDKGEKIKKLERALSESESKLDSIHDTEMSVRSNLEKQMRIRIDDRDREINTLKEKVKTSTHRAVLELDVIKQQNKNELEMIQEKVQSTMMKKKETIDYL